LAYAQTYSAGLDFRLWRGLVEQRFKYLLGEIFIADAWISATLVFPLSGYGILFLSGKVLNC
jgi:hypothetical protein